MFTCTSVAVQEQLAPLLSEAATVGFDKLIKSRATDAAVARERRDYPGRCVLRGLTMRRWTQEGRSCYFTL
jgi:hypothetical protein